MLKKVVRKRRKQALGSKCVTYTDIKCQGNPKNGYYCVRMQLHDPRPGAVLEEPRGCLHLGDRNMAGVYQATYEFLKDELKKITKIRFGHEPLIVYTERIKHGRMYHVSGIYPESRTGAHRLCSGRAKNIVDAYRDFWDKIINIQSPPTDEERMNS